MKRGGFTLLELIVVIGIMGLLGVMTIGGYRAMQRGMEERGVMDNADQFLVSAYQRMQIDRAPVVVYFWNEIVQEENDKQNISVVGHAIAVRRYGRVTQMSDDGYLYDEFSDWRSEEVDAISESGGGSVEEDNHTTGLYFYKMSGSNLEGGSIESDRSLVRPNPLPYTVREGRLAEGRDIEVAGYRYQIINGAQSANASWKPGDAYGFEFARISLPKNYIFGADSDYPKTLTSPVKYQKIFYSTTGSGKNDEIEISSLRPNASGEFVAQKVGRAKVKDL